MTVFIDSYSCRHLFMISINLFLLELLLHFVHHLLLHLSCCLTPHLLVSPILLLIYHCDQLFRKRERERERIKMINYVYYAEKLCTYNLLSKYKLNNYMY